MNRKIIFEHVSQRYDYDCGVAAVNTLIMMLGGEKFSADELEKRLGTTPDLGTSPVNIKRVLDEEKVDYMESRNGKFEDLERMIRDDFVCLVVYQAWWTEKEKDELLCGHYSIVIDIDDECVWLIDPGVEVETEPGRGVGVITKERKDFDKRWVDRSGSGEIYDHWMLTVRV